MPIIKSAKKALKQSKKRAERNKKRKKLIKTGIKLFLKKPTTENLNKAISLIDMAAKKNIFHKKKASRIKSKLTRQFNRLTKGKDKPSSAAPKASVKKLPKSKVKKG